jgi:hypothetical protein
MMNAEFGARQDSISINTIISQCSLVFRGVKSDRINNSSTPMLGCLGAWVLESVSP